MPCSCLSLSGLRRPRGAYVACLTLLGDALGGTTSVYKNEFASHVVTSIFTSPTSSNTLFLPNLHNYLILQTFPSTNVEKSTINSAGNIVINLNKPVGMRGLGNVAPVTPDKLSPSRLGQTQRRLWFAFLFFHSSEC